MDLINLNTVGLMISMTVVVLLIGGAAMIMGAVVVARKVGLMQAFLSGQLFEWMTKAVTAATQLATVAMQAVQNSVTQVGLVYLEVVQQQFDFVMSVIMITMNQLLDFSGVMSNTATGALQSTRLVLEQTIGMVSSAASLSVNTLYASMESFSKMMTNMQAMMDYVTRQVVIPALRFGLGLAENVVHTIISYTQKLIPYMFNGLNSLQQVALYMWNVMGPVLSSFSFVAFYIKMCNHVASTITGLTDGTATARINASASGLPGQVSAAIASIAVNWSQVGSVSLCDAVAQALVDQGNATGLSFGPLSSCQKEIAQFSLYYMTNLSFCRDHNVTTNLVRCMTGPVDVVIVPAIEINLVMPMPGGESATVSFGPYRVSDFIDVGAAIETLLNSVGSTITQNLHYNEIPAVLISGVRTNILDGVAATAQAAFDALCNNVRAALIAGCLAFTEICNPSFSFFGESWSFGPCSSADCASAVPNVCPSINFNFGGFT